MVPLDRNGKLLAEVLTGAEIVRIEEFHDRPEFGEPILHRCAGQSDSMPGVEAAYSFGLLGAFVFDILCLVKHNIFPLNRRKMLLVAQREGIRGDNDIMLFRFFSKCFVSEPFRPVMDHD